MRIISKCFYICCPIILSAITVFAQNTQNVQTAVLNESAVTPKIIPANNNQPAPWNIIPEKDILWKKRAWRSVDATTKDNSAFGYTAGKPGSNSLIAKLICGVISGKIKAYSDGQFSIALSNEEFLALVNAKGAIENITNYLINNSSVTFLGMLIC
jgi:hypothetical protein